MIAQEAPDSRSPSGDFSVRDPIVVAAILG